MSEFMSGDGWVATADDGHHPTNYPTLEVGAIVVDDITTSQQAHEELNLE
jgi:hypothetical protein